MTPRTKPLPVREARRLAREALREIASWSTSSSGGALAMVFYDPEAPAETLLDREDFDEEFIVPEMEAHERHGDVESWRECQPCQILHRRQLALAKSIEKAFCADGVIADRLATLIQKAFKRSRA